MGHQLLSMLVSLAAWVALGLGASAGPRSPQDGAEMVSALQQGWDSAQPSAAALERTQRQGRRQVLMPAADLHQLFLLLQAEAYSHLGQEGGGRRQELRRRGEALTRQLCSLWPAVPAYRLKHAEMLITSGQLAAAAEELSQLGRLAQEQKGERPLRLGTSGASR